MRRPRLSLRIRARIALTICVVSTGLLILMSAAIYIVFNRQLTVNLDDTLALRAEANIQLVDASHVPPVLPVSSDPRQELSMGEAVLRLYARDGSMLADASPATGVGADEQSLVLAALAKGQELYRTIDLANDEDYRVVASPISTGRVVSGVLITGLERSRVNKPLALLRFILLVATPLTAAVLALGGYWIARRALRPVAAMTATAERITHGDLHQRIAGSSTNDELGDLAATLNSMLARLSETVDRERRFTADASHELRTPLAAIETGIDVTLSQERGLAEYRRVLSVVRAQTQRLHSLAHQLLLLSRLDAEEVQVGFGRVDLGGLVEAVAESFRDHHQEATLRIDAPPTPLEVRGDLELLARALRNLLDNAAVHVAPNVSITIALREEPGNMALIMIEDDGPGIATDLAPEVFRRFRRGDQARAGGGTGLGLGIVEAIALAHGGSARLATPSEGRGARFELRLSLAK
jgi:two-component system OmpR family sensor kinase